MDPQKIVLEWITAVVAGSDPRPHVTELFDPPRGFPQLVVVYANAQIANRRDGRMDESFYTVRVGVTSWGAAARRPDYGTAWAALAPVTEALIALSEGPGGWESSEGHRIENASGYIATHAPDGDARQAVVTASWTFRVRRGPTV